MKADRRPTGSSREECVRLYCRSGHLHRRDPEVGTRNRARSLTLPAACARRRKEGGLVAFADSGGAWAFGDDRAGGEPGRRPRGVRLATVLRLHEQREVPHEG